MFQDSYRKYEKEIEGFIKNFSNSGEELGHQDRNTIKLFPLQNETLNIKSFKIPNIFNQVAYKFFRKSKAQRSFEYANKLKSLGVGTPQPIAYYEFSSPFLFKNSFYVSNHLKCDLTYRELCHDFEIPDHEEILRGFTRFTYDLHEKNINFLDHSPGNTLIKKTPTGYEYFLVDLNRMEFNPMNFEARMKNFARLTTHKFMVKTMSDEYAKCSGLDADKVFQAMWRETEAFQEKYHRKQRLKKQLKFWKK